MPPYEEDSDLPGVLRVNLPSTEYCADIPSSLIQRNDTPFKVQPDFCTVIYDQYPEWLSTA